MRSNNHGKLLKRYLQSFETFYNQSQPLNASLEQLGRVSTLVITANSQQSTLWNKRVNLSYIFIGSLSQRYTYLLMNSIRVILILNNSEWFLRMLGLGLMELCHLLESSAWILIIWNLKVQWSWIILIAQVWA